jgi:hypothetical protein
MIRLYRAAEHSLRRFRGEYSALQAKLTALRRFCRKDGSTAEFSPNLFKVRQFEYHRFLSQAAEDKVEFLLSRRAPIKDDRRADELVNR